MHDVNYYTNLKKFGFIEAQVPRFAVIGSRFPPRHFDRYITDWNLTCHVKVAICDLAEEKNAFCANPPFRG